MPDGHYLIKIFILGDGDKAQWLRALAMRTEEPEFKFPVSTLQSRAQQQVSAATPSTGKQRQVGGSQEHPNHPAWAKKKKKGGGKLQFSERTYLKNSGGSNRGRHLTSSFGPETRTHARTHARSSNNAPIISREM